MGIDEEMLFLLHGHSGYAVGFSGNSSVSLSSMGGRQ
jgi:hypothetical protein